MMMTGLYSAIEPYEHGMLWPRAELVIVDDAGHAADHPGLSQELVRATDHFAALR